MVGSQRFCVDTIITVRSFRIPSTSTINVRSASPETNCSLRRTLRIFLTEQITCSQTPPMCDAPGGGMLNFHSIFFWCRNPSIFCRFQPFMASRISLSLPVKLVLLSLIIFGIPLLLMNLQRALINESVSRDLVTSMWVAHIVKQEERCP